MRTIKPFEIGLVFWATDSAKQTLQNLEELGFQAGQLGISGELSLSGQADQWRRGLESHPVALSTAICSYHGESYADIPTVERTVGLVPEGTRQERVQRTKEIADLAAAVGIPSVACHIGFVPHERSKPLYTAIRDVARDIADYCGERGLTFALETGQEPADILLRFVEDVDRPNLKINFDPANMILYGTGDPLQAMEVLAGRIVSVHCKDGDPPPAGEPDALGKERALGQGSVGIPAFVEKLRAIGYTGILSIEREEPDAAVRTADIRSAAKLLQQLTGRN